MAKGDCDTIVVTHRIRLPTLVMMDLSWCWSRCEFDRMLILILRRLWTSCLGCRAEVKGTRGLKAPEILEASWK